MECYLGQVGDLKGDGGKIEVMTRVSSYCDRKIRGDRSGIAQGSCGGKIVNNRKKGEFIALDKGGWYPKKRLVCSISAREKDKAAGGGV